MVALLLIVTAFTLAACDSGVHSEEDWNKAMERLATCDAVTLTIEEKEVKTNNLVNKRTTTSTYEVRFDANKGIVYTFHKSKTVGLIGEEQGSGKGEDYYVADGSNIRYYKRNLNSSDKTWEGRLSTRYTSEEEVAQRLRGLYLFPKYNDNNDYSYLELTSFSYYSFSEDKNTYNRTEKEEYYDVSYKLTFTNGFLTKMKYEKVQNSSGPKNSRKYTIKIKYTASITLPTDLPEVK